MSRSFHFIVNGETQTVTGTSPTTTLLDWLRGAAKLCGTKEGCAEGDCGACTVAIGEPDGDRMHYRAVNSCLMMLPQIAGKLVLTVEGLARPDGTLHPVQRALVEADASQCGFCTPGIVMALFAYHRGGEGPDEAVIHDALAGNLCRCTGYRPIVEAAKQLAGAPADWLAEREPAWLAAVEALPRQTVYRAGGQAFLAPDSLAELARLRAANPDAHLVAGGTDLGLVVAKERRRLDTVIDLAHVPELRRIARGDAHVEIGAALPLSAALPLLDAEFPAMAALIRRFGSRQIRNLATFGGNFATASPIGDTLACLIALDATLALRLADRSREVPAESFFVGYRETALQPGELIEAIRIPRLRPGQTLHCYKVSKRFDQDISAVIAAFRLEVVDGTVRAVRAAYGGMAATPKRAPGLEAALAGKPWTQDTIDQAAAALAKDFTPISDFRASAGYRAKVAANLLRRLHLRTTRPDRQLEVSEL